MISVIDYGIGNLHSAHKALIRLGADARLTDDPDEIGDSDAVVLPGVGAFGACMAALRARDLEQPVLEAATSGRPFLGICVGMQMLFDASEESPGIAGLGVIPGTVRWITGEVKKPQMQWNTVDVGEDADPLFAGLAPQPWFYFVHSLHGVADDPSVVTATCEYGTTVNAAFRIGPVAAVQFHPEKSAESGLALLGNFVGQVARLDHGFRHVVTAQLYPSIDLRGGFVVRLRQGDYERETTYGDDPVGIAEQFAADGAVWVHVVDLDAARSGASTSRSTIAKIAAAVDGRAAVQAGGAVRSLDDAAEMAEAGVARVVMGSAAVADPRLVDVIAGRMPVAVALDHRRGVVAVHGWTTTSPLTLTDGLKRFAAASAFVITDIDRDGELSGPDVDGIAAAVAATNVPVIASGGVASLDDVRALAEIPGLGGMITGKALYENRFTVAAALTAIAEASP